MFAALKSFQPSAFAAALASTSAASTATAVAGKITEVVKHVGTSLDQEQEEFVNEKKRCGEPLETAHDVHAVALPPWVGFEKEDELKRDILALSLDKRNFIIDPPPDVDFQFDMKDSYNVAMVTLQADSSLEKMRFKLVPKHIKEPMFWRNYFYRCSLAQQALLLDGGEPGDAKRFKKKEDGDEKNRTEDAEVTEMPALATKTQVDDLKVNDAATKAIPLASDRTVMSSNGTDGSVEPLGDPDGWLEDELAKMQFGGSIENGGDGPEGAEEEADKEGGGGEVIADWERELQLELSDFDA